MIFLIMNKKSWNLLKGEKVTIWVKESDSSDLAKEINAFANALVEKLS